MKNIKANLPQYGERLANEAKRNNYWILFAHSKSRLEAKKISKYKVYEN